MARTKKPTKHTIIYRKSAKQSGKADPRFTIEGDGMATYKRGKEESPVIEFPTANGTVRMVVPRNVYIPGGEAVESVSFDVSAPTVSIAKPDAPADQDDRVSALEAQNAALMAKLDALMSAMVSQ